MDQSQFFSELMDVIKKLESNISSMASRTTSTKEDRASTTSELGDIMKSVANKQDVHVDEQIAASVGALVENTVASAHDRSKYSRSMDQIQIAAAQQANFAMGLAQLNSVSGQGKTVENITGVNTTDALESMMIGTLEPLGYEKAAQVLKNVAEGLATKTK